MERLYQSLPDARLTFGATASCGRETPESVHYINVMAHEETNGKPTGEPVRISFALTAPQMAQIVVHFFWHVCQRGVYGKFLRRLLTKRWATMTSPSAKSSVLDEGGYRMMQYHKSI